MNFKENQNFKDFKNIYNENPERIVFFVGAGMSMGLFPSWKELLIELLNFAESKSKLHYSKDELLEKINSGTNYLEIADCLVESIGKTEFREFIENHFDKTFTIGEIPDAYKSLLTLQFKSIITTNYDRIPDIGGEGRFNCYTNKSISESLKAIEKGKSIILKIHGDVVDQETIVFTESDYKTIIHNNTKVQNALRSLFTTSTICFIGFSFSDPHFNLILDSINSVNDGNSIIHYALLPTKSKFEINSLEKRFGIRVIEYPNLDNKHSEVTNFLNEIRGIKSIEKPIEEIQDFVLLMNLVEYKIGTLLQIQSYYLNFIDESSKLIINYFTRANSEHEQQREIIAILSELNFDTKLIKMIELNVFIRTEKTIEYVHYCPLVLTCKLKYDHLKDYFSMSEKPIYLWNKISFNQPFMVGNIHYSNREVNFPFINF